jgi:two-component system, NtrC family, nitrogen regulation response regulator GlnG
MKPIWIVDDDHSIRFVLEKALAREQLAVRTFSNARDVMAALEAGELPQAIVSDIRMPGGSGIELLQAAKARHPGLPVVIMTAYSDLDSAVAAFQGGAFEYLPKPFDVNKAVELIRRAMDEGLRETVGDVGQAAVPEMLGQAGAMQDVFRAIGRLSQSNVTVLVTGESGTGKELVARALHKHSPRADGPFVAINTAAIPKDLLESELFGHERGAFTGAQATRRGRFEQADGGTLFLDEIGDMPLDLQTRLLRVLSDGQFYRVGGHQPLKSNVRVIAATHQHLEDRVRQGVFREDLFHRLNVIRLRLPPLRERRDDVPMLTRSFLAKSARELGVEAKRVSDAALAQLSKFDFPGNVRQLENLCHWLTVMAPAQVVETKDLPPEVFGVPNTGGTLETAYAAAPFGGTVAHGASTLPVPSGYPAPAATGASPSLASSHFAPAQSQPGAGINASGLVGASISAPSWLLDLQRDARLRLEAGETGVWDSLSGLFEACLISTALDLTRGRRIEAAVKLGIGRNTITRKIQELEIKG